AALYCQTGRLVEHEDRRVFVKHHLREDLEIILTAHGLRGNLAVALAVDLQRRHADHLARLNARVGLGATAIDTHLRRTQQFLKMAEAQPRIVDLEPAIEPHARLVCFHLDLLYACHLQIPCLAGPDSISRRSLRATIPQTARQSTEPRWLRGRKSLE